MYCWSNIQKKCPDMSRHIRKKIQTARNPTVHLSIYFCLPTLRTIIFKNPNPEILFLSVKIHHIFPICFFPMAKPSRPAPFSFEAKSSESSAHMDVPNSHWLVDENRGVCFTPNYNTHRIHVWYIC